MGLSFGQKFLPASKPLERSLPDLFLRRRRMFPAIHRVFLPRIRLRNHPQREAVMRMAVERILFSLLSLAYFTDGLRTVSVSHRRFFSFNVNERMVYGTRSARTINQRANY